MNRAASWLAAVAVAVAAVGISTDSALAARAYDTSITPISNPWSVAFDGAGNAWIPDGGSTKVYKYDPYPSQTRLLAVDTEEMFGGYRVVQLAVDKSTGNFYMAQAGVRTVGVFDEDGSELTTWSSINGVRFASGGIHVAVDNTNSYSGGRVYLSLSNPENDVEAVDAERRPVQFPATADYIEGNAITGTPAGPFGEVEHIAVDEDGNIYVTDVQKNVIDEFASTGEFLRSFPAPTANYENPDKGGVAVDPTNGDVLIAEGSFNGNPEIVGVAEYDASGNFLGRIKETTPGNTLVARGTPAVDDSGHLYVPQYGEVDIFSPAPPRPEITYPPVSGSTATGGTLNAGIDPRSGGAVTACRFEYETKEQHEAGKPYELSTKKACTPDPAASPPGSNFTTPTSVSAELSGLSEKTYYYRVVVESPSGTTYGADQTYTPHKVVGLRTDGPAGVTESAVQLNGSLLGDGTPTTYFFEWGRTTAYGNSSAASAVGSPSGPSRIILPPLELTELDPFTTYHYRVVAAGGAGTSYGEDRSFTTLPGIPTVTRQWVAEVQSDRGILNAEVNPNGARTTAHFEFVDDATFQLSGFNEASRAPLGESGLGMGKEPVSTTVSLFNLIPDTVYHYRIVATNLAGVGVPSADRTFKTYPFKFSEECPNAHERQQTGAALLLDCRAYELASARNAGGYSVESSLVPGQTPFSGYPASGPSRLLYGVHDGGIPGTGSPTNHGVDPYVATRGVDGWTTTYVGIPADNPFATEPFASTLHEADAQLDTFAFGGPDICSPCFADGTAGEPVRLPDGRLVQGMAGSLDPGPGAQQSGYVGKPLSADGTHFVFGSTSKFEPDGNSTGDVSIYSRDLVNDVTHVVSKTPGGQTMTGSGIGELDISAEGDRVLLGRLVSTDSAGNRYWHLYMNVGNSVSSIDLMPGTTNGALYDGMSEDGSSVYFTTVDTPAGSAGGDGDTSADIFRADVTSADATVTRVSSGEPGTGETDSCDAAANTKHPRWNSLSATQNCDVLAVGGGGGVAPSGDAIYFLSPEKLDTTNPERQPVLDAPNLYVARPGSPTRFIATLESSANAPLPDAVRPLKRYFGPFGNPVGAAIDASNGDIYVIDLAAASVSKYDSEGNHIPAFGTGGAIPAPGVFPDSGAPTTIAVDNDPTSPNYQKLFVPSTEEGKVNIFSPEGVSQTYLEVPFPTAVAVDPATGNVYVASFGGVIYKFAPDGTPMGSFETTPALSGLTSIAVDSSGRVYVGNGGGPFAAEGRIEVYDSSGTHLTQLDPGPAKGVAVDPVDDHVYVDKGNEVREFDPSWNPVGPVIGVGQLSNSVSLGVAGGSLAVSNRGPSRIALFEPTITPSDPSVDSPLVIDSLGEGATRHSGEFQVNRSGDNAVFTSTLQLTEYENVDRREVIRYDAVSNEIDCASCNPTGEPASGEASLAADGRSLTDDGRVFFDSTEGLVDRDLNDVKDAYEWEEGEDVQLISTGTAPLASSLLGVSADGVDAYFFTRENLVADDENGSRVKIYDARSFGGFAYVPPPVPCKASDECHGPGSQAPPPPQVRTIAGTPIGNVAKPKPKCKKRKKCRRRRGKGRHHKAGRGAKKHSHRGDRRG